MQFFLSDALINTFIVFLKINISEYFITWIFTYIHMEDLQRETFI